MAGAATYRYLCTVQVDSILARLPAQRCVVQQFVWAHLCPFRALYSISRSVGISRHRLVILAVSQHPLGFSLQLSRGGAGEATNHGFSNLRFLVWIVSAFSPLLLSPLGPGPVGIQAKRNPCQSHGRKKCKLRKESHWSSRVSCQGPEGEAKRADRLPPFAIRNGLGPPWLEEMERPERCGCLLRCTMDKTAGQLGAPPGFPPAFHRGRVGY